MFKIEKNVPLVTRGGKSKDVSDFCAKIASTFEKMEIGDSFVIPFSGLKKTTLQGRIKIASRMAYENGSVTKSFNIKTRLEGDSIRIWRNIEKAEDQA